ncbi:TetR/AcrR family transcriptional regulator C-terminal domain-containing protein [Streptomyces sp. NBC_01232]|uniref:TetR/AcrR family transcriptional regulator C-terminal domain-containing protein n=1 Tax=unclassified Streptomyces TaxID=2593676 RepID=UPI002E0EB43D|nr:TetR/AcrR family transcriptional regulator C-terminal domain-containing protein [Streptomyces sp. NBC_01232]
MSPAPRRPGGGSAAPPDLATVADLLWRVGAERTADGRPRLTPRRIVDAAVAVVDADGLDALSMQRVATELGCTAMALYRHVPGREHLLAAMADAAAGRPPAATGEGWRAEVEAWVDALWSTYGRHPWMVRIPTASAPVGPNELAWFEALLSPLARSGAGRGELIPLATFISGAVRDLARIATELDPAGAASYGRILAERLDPGNFPTLCALAGEPGLGEDEDGAVEPIVACGIARLLDGIESSSPAKEGNG